MNKNLVSLVVGLAVSIGAFSAVSMADEDVSVIRTLSCTGKLDLAASQVPAAHYYQQDQQRYGIDKVNLYVGKGFDRFSLGLTTDVPVALTGNTARGGQPPIFPDPNGASTRTATLHIARTQMLSGFDFASVWSTADRTKISYSFFANVRFDAKGSLDVIMTSGALRRYHYDLVCSPFAE